jgi:peptidoglycan/xylan/chitin deacetylase (PgdA/CDA1 family)
VYGLGVILEFHRVLPKSENRNSIDGMEVTPDFLENCIRHYHKTGYSVVSIDEVYRILIGQSKSRRFVTFTFDDGYIDNLIYAYPVFRKYHVPFAIYLTTGFIDRTAVMWWYLLKYLVSKLKRIQFRLMGNDYIFICETESQKTTTYRLIKKLIIDSSPENFHYKTEQIFAPYFNNIFDITEKLTLNWDQIRQMAQDPMVTFGAHTVNHLALASLSDKDMEQEIVKSKHRIESVIGSEVGHFSYPYGGSTKIKDREFDFARSYGFKTAITTLPGFITPEHKNRLERLPRLPCGGIQQNLKFLSESYKHKLSIVNHRLKAIMSESFQTDESSKESNRS